MACLPWWHTQFAALGGRKRVRIRSGCALSGGNIQCAPESMRRSAEAKMRAHGYPISLSLAEYTLARYMSSEVGSGTPEEKVAVAEAARNKSNGNVNALLLYRQRSGHPNRGYYGPIHGPDGVKSAPYGRWASTRAEPGVDDILIAKFVLAGKSKHFAKGANDQIGMEYIDNPRYSIEVNARRRDYWVGPLPGVDHWHTFLYARRKNIDPNSPEGRALVARALRAVATKARPDWSGLPICKKPIGIPWVPITVGVALSAALYFVGRRRWWPF
jgi:hypothetical protein